jgi:FtsZ-binding cell division protein ZapB
MSLVNNKGEHTMNKRARKTTIKKWRELFKQDFETVDIPGTIRSNVRELIDALESLESENAELKETNTRLNRRCQSAEASAMQNVEACKKASVSFGRSLGNWYATKLLAENADLRKKLEYVVEECNAARAEKRALQLEGERMRGTLGMLITGAGQHMATRYLGNGMSAACYDEKFTEIIKQAEAALSSSPSAFAEEFKKKLLKIALWQYDIIGDCVADAQRDATILLRQLEGKE